MIVNVARNRRVLKFLTLKLFKVNGLSESKQHSLVTAQRHRLSEAQEWRIIGRVEEGDTKMKVVQDLDIFRSVITRVSSSILSSGYLDRPPG